MLKILGTTGDVTTCDCCLRADLKKTVVVRNLDSCEVRHYGVDCAAKILGRRGVAVARAARVADGAREFAVFTRIGVEVRRFARGTRAYVEAALKAEASPASWYVAAAQGGAA